MNLWIGNNPASDGSAAIVPGTPDGWWEGYYGAIAQAEAAEGRELRPSEVSSHFTRRALGWALEEPGAWAAHMLWKTRLLLSNVELANNSDVEFTAVRTMPPLRFTPSRWDLLLGFGLMGLLLGVRKGQRGAGTLALYLGVYSVSIVLFFVSARFRVPLVPILAIGAGHAVSAVAGAIKAREGRSVAILLYRRSPSPQRRTSFPASSSAATRPVCSGSASPSCAGATSKRRASTSRRPTRSVRRVPRCATSWPTR